MTPSPDLIRDFSRLQADCRVLVESNVCFAQENARLREALNKILYPDTAQTEMARGISPLDLAPPEVPRSLPAARRVLLVAER